MAGKKYDGGTVHIDGKADLKDIINESKKAEKATGKLGKSAHSTDRQLKGAARASSGASKNFSKMSQGITGGLVPAYATLAANLFALDAVFRFLKSSADFRVLKEGQLAFAAATGVAYQSLARDLQTATRGMINFRDAAQAGAIGRAAGLSAGQLKELSNAAFTVSVALGRDVTDSFNRLVRGVTKAEPELLDELGIVLRLEEATTKYAAALGLNKNQLSIYQKSQAVVNEVLDQTETKFGKINAIMEPQANAISQLGVAFEEAIDAMRPAIAAIAEFVANFGKKNIDVLVLAILGFAGGILKSVIPATHELRSAQAAQAADYEARLDILRAKQEALRQSKLRLANTPISQQNLAAELSGVQLGGVAGQRLASGEALSGQQIGNLKAQLGLGEGNKRGPIGVFKSMSEGKRNTINEILTDMQKDGGKMSKTMKLNLQQAGVSLDIFKEQAGTFSDRVGMFFDNITSKILRFVGFIGALVAVASVLYMIGKAVYNFIRKDQIARTEKFNEKLKEQHTSLERINTELMKMAEVSRKGLLDPGSETDIFRGNALESADLESRITALDQLREQADLNREGFAEFQLELLYTFQNLKDIHPEFEKFADELRETGDLSEFSRKKLEDLSESILTVKAAQFTLTQTSGELIKAQNRLTQSLPKVPYQDIIELLNTQQRAYRDLVNEGKDYELHLKRVGNQLEIFTIMQENANKLTKKQLQLDVDNAVLTTFAGDNTSRRQLGVRKAQLSVEKEIQKLNDLQLQIKTAELNGDDAKLTALLQQRDLQVDMIVKAEKLYDLEKKRADQMAMTVNTIYGNLEKDLGQAIGAAMRGDSSGFEKIGTNFTKTMTDAIGQFLSEQFIEDIIPDALKPVSIGEEIALAGNKHAEEVREAIKDGAMFHGEILKGENTTLNKIFEEQKRLNAAIAKADADATRAKIDQLEIDMGIASKKTTAQGILDFRANNPQEFEREARDFELKNRSTEEQKRLDQLRIDKIQLEKDLLDLQNKKASGVTEINIKNPFFDPLQPGAADNYFDSININTAIKNAQNELKNNTASQEAVLGNYLNEYETFLDNNKTLAIETRDKLIDSIDDLKGVESLQLKRAGIYTNPVSDPNATPVDPSLINLPTTLGPQQDFQNGFNMTALNNMGTSDPNGTQVIFNPDTGETFISSPNLAGKIKQSLGLDIDRLSGEDTDNKKIGEKEDYTMDKFSKNLNQFSGVIGMMGALTGEEEKTAKIMAKVAQIQLLIAMYERAKIAFDAGGGPLSILKTFFFGPAGRQGGIMSAPGYRSYADGGVSTGPNSGYGAVLHGTEAVVPLPNGKSIPVDIGKGKMSTNNTTINVNIDDSGASADVTADGAAELGAVINAAVQNELEKQMRPGGILGG